MEELIEELTKVSSDKLSKEGLKLFEKINEIIDENNKLKQENKDYKIKYLALMIGQFPDTTATYKKYKKELDELLNKGE